MTLFNTPILTLADYSFLLGLNKLQQLGPSP